MTKNLNLKAIASILTLLIMALTPDIMFASDGKYQQVPLFDDGVMIRVSVNVFGKTLYFMVDTGFTLSAFDIEFHQNLGVPVTTYFAGSPLGAGKTLPIFHCPEMAIAEKLLNLNAVSCLDLKMAKFISGQQCDGILGMDLFSTNVVSIDFDKNLFSLSETVPESVKNTFISIPLKKMPQYYTMDVLVNHNKHLELMIDTGDNSSVSLNSQAWQEVFGDDQTNVVVATVADAVNQVAQSKIGVIGHLTIGNLNYTNLHATFVRNPGTPSHIGLGFFKRHNVVFDFSNQVIYLEPGQNFSIPDKEDMSGLHLIREGEMTIVYSIDENSPAFDIGIRAKDIIEAINGQKTSLLTMKNLREMLQSGGGNKVSLQVNREENTLNFGFFLKKAI